MPSLRRRYERTGRDGPLRELRADLRAVQLVGRDAVTAMLDGHTVANQIDQRLHDIAPTHPTPQLRRAAVTNYDPTDDPLEAAQSLRQNTAGCSRASAGSRSAFGWHLRDMIWPACGR